MKKKSWTGERLEAFVFNRDTIDHLHRYAIAKTYIQNRVVLDIASGEGYGSHLLSENAKYVYGVDIDKDAIALAQKKYAKDNLKFLQGRADQIPIEDNSIDVVVSFETIEHHDKHQEMMLEIKRVLKPNGLLVISTPDRLEYTDKPNYVNPFHVKELYRQEFEELIGMHFSNAQFLLQKFINGNSFVYDDSLISEIDVFTGDFDKIDKQDLSHTYIVSIASNCSFLKYTTSFFNGINITKTSVKLAQERIYHSNTYKVGHFVISPFKFLKKILK